MDAAHPEVHPLGLVDEQVDVRGLLGGEGEQVADLDHVLEVHGVPGGVQLLSIKQKLQVVVFLHIDTKVFL